MLPIKEIRLKMFQHERQPLKPTSGLLSLKYEGRPHGLAVEISRWGKQSHTLLCSTWWASEHIVSTENSCSDVHETIIWLSLYYTCRRVADPYWIANGFHFLRVFCWHSVLTRVHRGQVCLLPSLVPLWNRKLLGMSKWTWEAGVVFATEFSVPEISLPVTSPIPARGIQVDRTFKVCGQLSSCGWILLFSSF